MRRYEDFAVGDAYRSALARTVTETDNLLFTMLAMNTNELHFNEEAARATEWGKPLVNSTFTLALVLGLSVADTTQAGGVNLGWTEIRLPRPVFVGDTLRSETEVTAVRESASRPRYGIVSVRTRGLNQRDEVVCEFDRSFLIPRREDA
jgi:acyl dehydratase